MSKYTSKIHKIENILKEKNAAPKQTLVEAVQQRNKRIADALDKLKDDTKDLLDVLKSGDTEQMKTVLLAKVSSLFEFVSKQESTGKVELQDAANLIALMVGNDLESDQELNNAFIEAVQQFAQLNEDLK